MNVAGLKNVIWREGKHYVAQSLNVDVSSFGETKKEALDNLREALELYFEDAPGDAASSVEEPEIVSI
ncbi:MAG: type II toxin-antitoxin system HicB family antitoxin [Patescibacteria group bacterium]|nr:type II toxin-antitoxin system HicB family antitoxin [Patescibacteria group bacterium]